LFGFIHLAAVGLGIEGGNVFFDPLLEVNMGEKVMIGNSKIRRTKY